MRLTELVAAPKMIDGVAEEAFEYGQHRGGASATGDKYATLGGPSVDDALQDYLRLKFGISGNLVELSKTIQRVPRKVLDEFNKGFEKGYSETSRAISLEDID